MLRPCYGGVEDLATVPVARAEGRATALLAPQICPSGREPVSGSTLAAAHIISTYAALPRMGLRIPLPTLASVRRVHVCHPAH